MSEKIKDSRARNFATVVYPESAPDGWQEVLASHFVPAFISPLHDSDKNPTGEPKKSHYHVVIMHEGKKTIEQANDIFFSIGGVGCEVVKSIRGYARYLCHLDNPEKAQYDPSEVRCLCGADYIGTIGLVLDKYKAVSEIIDFCVEKDLYSYSDLLEYARLERFDWFRVLCDNATIVVREYLKSREWTKKRLNNSLQFDSSTGEIIQE
jgi:plasmid replication protein